MWSGINCRIGTNLQANNFLSPGLYITPEISAKHVVNGSDYRLFLSLLVKQNSVEIMRVALARPGPGTGSMHRV